MKAEADLRRAIENSELELLYQPVIELSTNKVVGAEALVHWHHPERRLVQAPEFVPLAERTGLIMPLGRWVLKQACLQAAKWGNLQVSVNVSARQLQDGRIVNDAHETLEATGIRPDKLVLEVTESILIDSRTTALSTLHDLHKLGVILSLDDFGSGYSNLAYLRHLPLHTLKLDRSLVEDVTGQGKGDLLVRSVLNLAESFGLVSVAEGIEMRQQAEGLCNLGCQYAQGYYFSRPVRASQVPALLSDSGIVYTRR